MNVIYSVKDYVSNVFHQDSGSGAIDVVAVQQPDGSLQCLPFHVHFGKLKQEKKQQVVLQVNGHVIPSVRMKLDSTGKAYFVHQQDYATSSSPSPPSSIGDEDDLIHRRSLVTDDNNKSERSDEEEPSQRHLTWQSPAFSSPHDDSKLPQIVKNGSMYFDAVDLDVTVESDGENVEYYDHPFMSLCGHLLDDSQTNDEMDRIFANHLVPFDTFRLHSASLLANPNLRFFVHGKITSYTAEMQAYLLSRVIFPYSPHLPLCASHNEDKSTHLWGSSEDGGVTEDTASLRSELYNKKRFQPSHEELVAMDLQIGANELVFILQAHDTAEPVARVTTTLYVWPVHAKVVIAQMDGAIASCGATGGVFKRRDPGAIHLGALEFYSKLVHNGYHIVYVTGHDLSQANILQSRLCRHVREKGDVSLPLGPVLLSSDRLLSPDLPSEAHEVNVAALDALRSLFPRCVNPFYAAFSTTEADNFAFTKVGVFSGKVFQVDPIDGSLRHQSMTCFHESYTSLLDRMDRMFPPLNSSTAQVTTYRDHESGRSSCSTTLRASSSQEDQFVSETGLSKIATPHVADEAYNDVNFWRIEPLRV